MKCVTVVAAFALSAIASSVAAQQPVDQRSDRAGLVRVADNKKCPSVIINFPKHTIARDELDNKLPKNIKWDQACVAKNVGLYNQSLDDLGKKLDSPTCDPNLTQHNVEVLLKDYKESYDRIVPQFCKLSK